MCQNILHSPMNSVIICNSLFYSYFLFRFLLNGDRQTVKYSIVIHTQLPILEHNAKFRITVYRDYIDTVNKIANNNFDSTIILNVINLRINGLLKDLVDTHFSIKKSQKCFIGNCFIRHGRLQDIQQQVIGCLYIQ